jgi:hypothetical protein
MCLSLRTTDPALLSDDVRPELSSNNACIASFDSITVFSEESKRSGTGGYSRAANSAMISRLERG